MERDVLIELGLTPRFLKHRIIIGSEEAAARTASKRTQYQYPLVIGGLLCLENNQRAILLATDAYEQNYCLTQLKPYLTYDRYWAGSIIPSTPPKVTDLLPLPFPTRPLGTYVADVWKFSDNQLLLHELPSGFVAPGRHNRLTAARVGTLAALAHLLPPDLVRYMLRSW